jgi:hypothetical protein
MAQTNVPQMYGRSASCFQAASWNSDWYSSGCQDPPGAGLGGLRACWVVLAPTPYSDMAILRDGEFAFRLSAQAPRSPSLEP